MFAWLRNRIRGLTKRAPREERQLLAICRGDVEQMQRLVEFERKRRPELTQRQACRMAIERYQRDQ